ncbi:potassium-transporting ATPase subunit KdpC [Luteitalea sp.]
MTADLIRGVRFALVTMLLFGGAYPLVVWSLARTVLPHQAEGSLIRNADGEVIGSPLVAQPFTDEAYFAPRPSGVDYDSAATGGTNVGPTNADHLAAVRERVAAVRARNGHAAGAIPADLVTASGAGLDPHLSPAAIALQVARVAAARGETTEAIDRVVAAHTEAPTFGVLGRPRVNVLRLNLALDAAFPRRAMSHGAGPTHD